MAHSSGRGQSAHRSDRKFRIGTAGTNGFPPMLSPASSSSCSTSLAVRSMGPTWPGAGSCAKPGRGGSGRLPPSGLGDERSAVVAACGSRSMARWCRGFELDDVHRWGCPSRGRRDAVRQSSQFSSAEPSLQRARLSRCRGRRLRNRSAGRISAWGQEHIGQGWHSGATLGVFSAASGAAAALRLDTGQTVNAIGIAGTQSAGLMAAQYGCDGEAMACRTLRPERILRRIILAHDADIYRHPERLRERVWRLLLHILALP